MMSIIDNSLLNSIQKVYDKKIESIEIFNMDKGLRNQCFRITINHNIEIFCKKYNDSTRFSSFFNVSRCILEKRVCDFLLSEGCSVPKVLFSDYDNEITMFQYYKGETLKDALVKSNNKNVLIERCLEELSMIHKIDSSKTISGVKFRKPDKIKYTEYFTKSFRFILENLHIEICPNLFKEFNESIFCIVNEIEKTNLNYGHFELHHDNILIQNDKVIFLDFEKFYPHILQIDLVSLLVNKGFDFSSIKNYLNYYIYINKIKEEEKFLIIFDFVNIMENLRYAYKILRNSMGFQIRWTMNEDKRKKIMVIDEEGKGTEWNTRRNEDFYRRIDNISLSFSESKIAKRLRKLLVNTIKSNKRHLNFDKECNG